MKLSRLAISLYVGLVFASGAVLGAFGHRLYSVSTVVSAKQNRNAEEFRKRVIAEMQGRLKLSGEQVTKLNFIMDDTRSGRGNAAEDETGAAGDPRGAISKNPGHAHAGSAGRIRQDAQGTRGTAKADRPPKRSWNLSAPSSDSHIR